MKAIFQTYICTREVLTILVLFALVFAPVYSLPQASHSGGFTRSIVPPLDIKEVSALATEPFGGYSYMIWYCTCQFAIIHYVGPPRPGAYLYQLGASYPYANYQVYRPGVWLLGKFTRGNYACRFYVPPASCGTLPAIGMMTEVGTSF